MRRWNFHNATKLTLNGSNKVYGAIHAPNATIENNNNDYIYGQIVTNNMDFRMGTLDYQLFSAQLPMAGVVLAADAITLKGDVEFGTVNLNWTVKDEVMMDQYIVEGSIDGKSFTSLKTTQAIGDGAILNYNTKLYAEELNGANLFRIRGLLKDGNLKYSSIVRLMYSAKSHIAVAPNPFITNLAVSYNSDAENAVNIILRDLQGKL